ncbi:MAG: RNA polymerase sigma factor [Planctomycetaceae bacterium]|jgi:RNA polymerase sigma-70 factor (ECF subfamily)|nr:RNA polymerase sigma factor [Planctomycetaceae bacterium]
MSVPQVEIRQDITEKSKTLPPGNNVAVDWELALRENESWLRSVIAAQAGEYAAIDEIWQNVSLAAVKQQSPLQDVTRIGAWLYQLAVRQSLLYRRTMGRRRKLVERYTEHVLPVSYHRAEQNPLELLLAEERHEQVRQAMTTLSQDDREALLLKYIHGWSYQEMAETLGVTISSVQSRLFRARQRLREILEKI